MKNLKRVVILGLGGTGSILVPLLARWLFSQKFSGKIILIDGDSYLDNNVNRQIFSAAHLGKNKAEYQAMVINSHIPAMSGQIEIVDKYVGKDDVEELIQEETIVVNCSDNLAARKLVEDRVSRLSNAIHICCGNELTTGQVQIHARKNGVDITPSIYQRSPAFNSESDDRSKMSCEELAALPGGGQLITANATAAVLALNMFVQATSKEPMFMGGAWYPNDFVAFNTHYNAFAPEGVVPPNVKGIQEYAAKRF